MTPTPGGCELEGGYTDTTGIFLLNVSGIEDAKDIEFQKIHRISKPSQEGKSRAIIARFFKIFGQGKSSELWKAT